MAFLDSIEALKGKAAEAAMIAAKKTKQLAEIAKANVSIYGEEDKIKKAEAELGKLYYRDYAVGEEMDTAEYLPWCQKIDDAKQTIADLRDYIEELKSDGPVEPEENVIEIVDEEAVSDADFADMEEPEVEIEIVVTDAPETEE